MFVIRYVPKTAVVLSLGAMMKCTFLFLIFFKILFNYLRERERESESTQVGGGAVAEGEALNSELT